MNGIITRSMAGLAFGMACLVGCNHYQELVDPCYPERYNAQAADASPAMRKVCDEMSDHAKVICEEFSLANFQLQMGRPRREVLHDLGVRTGVDDVRSLAAILIQADRFGSSIAQALRVQSDSMRTRRKQIAEEKAAKTAVQLLFPLILFIFPGIFVVLVGPAAINIMETLLKPQ